MAGTLRNLTNNGRRSNDASEDPFDDVHNEMYDGDGLSLDDHNTSRTNMLMPNANNRNYDITYEQPPGAIWDGGNSFLDDMSSSPTTSSLSQDHANNIRNSSSASLMQQHAAATDYNGYYSQKFQEPIRNGNNDSQFLQQPLQNSNRIPSSTSINTGLSNNAILAPPEFDRYPLVGGGATSSQHNNNNNNNNSTSNNDSSLDVDSANRNPFMVEQDFSPFGGYPASSFPLMMDEKEDDDFLHNPDPEEEARLDKRRFVDDFKNMDKRSFGGLTGVVILLLGAVAIFVILPALTFTGVVNQSNEVQLIDVLSPYQYPTLAAIRTSLVDPDTPSTAKSRQARDGSYWKLVFSDEFNAEGRTFYDGDDQFWTGPDIHYAATKDLEWYSPDACTTANGTLKLRMDAYRNHNLYYRSGMLQSWNKLCFTQGILEISANLPNYGRVTGLWPGLWTLGNLARPGYLASAEGLWPYSYDSCDAGITPNQSSDDGISYLPGQRLSVCTCDGEDHPNQGVGRGAPEIDIIEGEADTTLGVGIASQSLQVAPFDIWYIPDYDFIEVHNFTTTQMNSYCGGPFQQAVSAVTTLNTSWYEFGPEAGYYQKYALEYLNDDDNGYIRWFVGDIPTFTVTAKALHPNGNIGWRRISKEPMSIIMNLGISNNWAYIDWQSIYFPVQMSIDYVRIYQPSDAISLTCDPEDYPTYDYIQAHLNAYSNPNLTSWESAGYTFPKNILTGNCKSSKFSLGSN